jgi:hypothetical protein
MRDGLEKYLEDVLCRANLAPPDERIVEAELREHLQSLLEASVAAGAASSPHATPTEVYAMLENEFGRAKVVGSSIARAKGRFRTYLKKQMYHLPLKIAVALVLAFGVRCAVAQSFYASGNGAAPQIPVGSAVLVYKLARTFSPGDVIVFRVADGTARLGIVKSSTNGNLIVHNNGLGDQPVAMDHVVGRVILNTR